METVTSTLRGNNNNQHITLWKVLKKNKEGWNFLFLQLIYSTTNGYGERFISNLIYFSTGEILDSIEPPTWVITSTCALNFVHLYIFYVGRQPQHICGTALIPTSYPGSSPRSKWRSEKPLTKAAEILHEPWSILSRDT